MQKVLPSRIHLKDVTFARDVISTANVVNVEIKEKAHEPLTLARLLINCLNHHREDGLENPRKKAPLK